MNAPSAEKLLEIVRQYYSADPKYVNSLERSPERKRYAAKWQRVLDSTLDRWRRAVVDEVERELPGYLVLDLTGPDAAFTVAAYADGFRPKGESVVVGHLSMLTPVYAVYAVRYQLSGRERVGSTVHYDELPEELRPAAEVIARRIEAEFEAPRIPASISQTPIPFYVDYLEPGEATLFHALFNQRPDNLVY